MNGLGYGAGKAIVDNMNRASEEQPKALTEAPSGNDSSLWMGAFTPARLAGLVAIFLFILYPGVVLGAQSFFFRDFGLFTYPAAYYAHESFWHGQMPLWNPLNNCGVPFLAQWNTSVCYPLSLVYLVFPLPWSLNFFCLAHLVLAGVGMHRLAYRWTQNRLAASIAGLVFALNGLMLNSLMWTSNLAALSWQPLVMLWAEQAWRHGGPRRVALAALAGAMQMLSGAPEIIVFTWALLGMLWLAQGWKRNIPVWLTLCRFVLVVVLTAGLSAIQLLPFFDLLKHSERDVTYVVADANPMPLWGWANFVVPVFHCLQTTFGTCLEPDQPWTASYYLGTAPLALAWVAAWRLRWRPLIWGLAGMTLAGLVLALGNDGHVYAWLKHLAPWIGFSRYPIKFVSIPIFAIPLLAAFGFDCLQNKTPDDVKRNLRLLFLAAAFLLLVAVFILAIARWRLPSAYYQWQWTWSDGGLRALFLVATVGAIAGLTRMPTPRSRGLMGLAILALTGFDLITAGLRVNPVVVAKAFGPLELNMTSHPELGKSRAMLSRQIASYLSIAWTKNPLYYLVGVRGALYENCNVAENIPKVDGFCSLHLREEWDVDALLYGFYLDLPQTNTPADPLLDFLGVSQISAPNTIFAWQARKAFLPLATAGQRPIFASDAEVLRQLNSKSFDPRQTVYLPLSARSKVAVTNGSNAKVIFQQFGTQQARLTVEAPAPALVVIAQSFYHDWHAYVDSKPVPLLRANHAFQALEVSAGQHEVTLHYEDSIFRLGALLSALTLLGCLAGLFQKSER
jgi:hypothetical protein